MKESDAFASIDILPKVRQRILQRLDHWNQKTSLKIDSSFKVLSKTISSQIKHFLENTDTFLKQAKPSNIPENIIGYELLKEKLGTQEAKTLVQSEIYSDQPFYVQLLRYLAVTGHESDVNLREEESQLRHDQGDKPRMSEAKTSKARRICYTTIEKLQNFVERTTNKASTNAELADLLIRSYFKA
uniref:Apoptosis-antagonizing transcription factor C-terminal domain-containing protein n=1 Tax=Babesia bovis TaxID=5865 RepID=S6BMH8_BABBO|nr:hypothetical protein [Babesia bovis]